VGNGPRSDVDELRDLAQAAADSAEVAAEKAVEAANKADAASRTANRAVSTTEVLIISVGALAVTLLVVLLARGSATGGPPVFDLIAILAVGLAIGLVALGVGGTVWSDTDRAGQNYIERELIANRARRASMVGLAFVVIGALLLTTTMIVVGVKVTSDAKPTPSASADPGPSASTRP
jgi:hypothetical protein